MPGLLEVVSSPLGALRFSGPRSIQNLDHLRKVVQEKWLTLEGDVRVRTGTNDLT